MDKKYKIIGGVCGAVCIGGLAAGIFFYPGFRRKAYRRAGLCNERVIHE